MEKDQTNSTDKNDDEKKIVDLVTSLKTYEANSNKDQPVDLVTSFKTNEANSDKD